MKTGIFNPRVMFLIVLLCLFILCNMKLAHAEIFDNVNFVIPKVLPETHYSISLSFDEKVGKFAGNETITVKNKGEGELSTILIDWLWGLPAEYEVQDSSIPCLSQKLSGNRTLLRLNESVPQGGEFNIKLGFWFTAPPEHKGMLKLTFWYPRLEWVCETLDNYKLQFKTPDGYSVLTSAPETEPEVYTADGIRSFGVILSDSLDVISKQSGDVCIKAFSSEETEKCSQFITDVAADVIEFYTQFHGFYPHRILAIIPGADDPMGGYPVASGIVCVHGQGKMDDEPLSHWQFITAHEIGHQYWMENVLQAPRAKWLMIGLGVYADREYMLSRGYGDDHEREMMDCYIDGVRKHIFTRMDLSESEKQNCGFDYNNVVTHGKGFSLISSLACYLGKEQFKEIYNGCLCEYRGQMLDHPEFQRYCESLCQEDLDWFFEQWVFSNKHLYFETELVDQRQIGSVFEYDVKVSNLGTLEMPIPVDAGFSDGTNQRQFTNWLTPESLLTFTCESELERIVLDRNGELPLLDEPLEYNIEELQNQITSFRYLSGKSNKMLQLMNQSNMEEIKNPRLWLKTGMLLYEGKHYDSALQAFASGLECSEEGRQYPFLAWMGMISDLQGQHGQAIAYYREAMSQMDDDSYVRHDQYGIIVTKKWLIERLSTPFQGE